MKEKEIGEFFRGNFAGYEPLSSDSVWENIRHDQAIKRYNKTRLFKRILGYSTATLVVVAALIAGYFLLRPSPQPVPPPDMAYVDTTTKEQVVNQSVAEKNEITETVQIMQTNTGDNTGTVKNTGYVAPSENKVPVTVTPSPATKTKPIPENTMMEGELHVLSEPLPEMPEINLPDITVDHSAPMVSPEAIQPEEIIHDVPAQPGEDTRLESVLLIPKAFTPNNDGLNDDFLVFASSGITDFEMYIYDRGGRIVFKSSNIDTGWDGRISGQPAPEGAYVYLIRYRDSAGINRQEKGSLILIK